VNINFGTSSPKVYASNGYYNGYQLINSEVAEIDEKKLTAPTVAGKIGQVLMVTANGYEWKNIPGGYSSAIADNFQLQPGWNLVSLPDAELTDSCKNELLKAYDFFTFNAKMLPIHV
jgi:hypothetical protein